MEWQGQFTYIRICTSSLVKCRHNIWFILHFHSVKHACEEVYIEGSNNKKSQHLETSGAKKGHRVVLHDPVQISNQDWFPVTFHLK
jgi:hypothetical protein